MEEKLFVIQYDAKMIRAPGRWMYHKDATFPEFEEGGCSFGTDVKKALIFKDGVADELAETLPGIYEIIEITQVMDKMEFRP